MHSHIYGLDRIIPKTDDDRCSVYADAIALTCEDIGVRLHPRNFMYFKDGIGGTDRVIEACRHPFVEHCKDALQIGVFVIIRFYVVMIFTGIVSMRTDGASTCFSMYPVQMGYHLAVDFISTAIVLICTYLELIDSKFVSISSVIDFT